MENNKTQFVKDAANKQIKVTRYFDASLELVWRTWTESELLEQWWAPHPFKAITKHMDFREGGYWLYYMLGPDGSKFWVKADYCTIEVLKRFDADDSFCDEEGIRNYELPGMRWNNVFTLNGTGTNVNVSITFTREEDLEKIISMGFKEGFTAAHNNLDELLKNMNHG